MMKNKDGKVMTDEKSVLRLWKEYYKGLMNEDIEREKGELRGESEPGSGEDQRGRRET